jgi:hypothetical protein
MRRALASMVASIAVLGAVAVLAATSPAGAIDFPPFLAPDQFAAETRAEIEALWKRRTTTRTTIGRPARVPLELYRLFVDLPNVTTAAAQHLGLTTYRIMPLGPDRFAVEDNEGAKGTYEVVLRRPTQRVLLTRVERTTWVLGHVSAAAVMLLTLSPDTARDGRPQTAQRIDSAVEINHRILAFVVRVLTPAFPRYADRKASEVFNMAVEASAWAYEKPTEFCRWLRDQPGGRELRREFAGTLSPCRD